MKPSRVYCYGCNSLFPSQAHYMNHGLYNKACTAEARFWGRVNKNAPGGCWIFMGCLDGWGYGDIHFKGKHIQAHRLAWKLLRSDPGELDVLHQCNNPPCCNPDHMYLGTDKENAADRVKAGVHAVGEASPKAVLSEKEVLAIRAEYWCKGRKSNIKALAAKYPHISAGALYCAATGRSWSYLK